MNRRKEIHAFSYQKHTQYYPKSGWTEHDPDEIWKTILEGVQDVLQKGKVQPHQIEAVGLANQGETVLFWDSHSGQPLYPAIVWSCRRSQSIAERWELEPGWRKKVIEKTGLRLDPYFSATKIRWMMEEVEQVQEQIQQNRARCSTLDSWLIWKMTGGASYVTDPSTAARTLLYNIKTCKWDQEILSYLDIQQDWLPNVVPTIGLFGMTNPHIFCGIEAPIKASVVDQPAALYGHLCVDAGTSKCTYGTGCFTYMNIGSEPPAEFNNTLLSTIIWEKDEKITYALDGAIYSAGSVIDWGRNALNLYDSIEELQEWSEEWYHSYLLSNEKETMELKEHLWFVPSLNGIGAPYWNSDQRGIFLGISHRTSKKEMARSILEGIAQRVADVFDAMKSVSVYPLTVLKVDGGLTTNSYLMQFQSDILGIPVEVPNTTETTALGVGYLVGEGVGWWSIEELQHKTSITKTYYPKLSPIRREQLRKEWKNIIGLMLDFYSKKENFCEEEREIQISL